jgi:hypothetical protein
MMINIKEYKDLKKAKIVYKDLIELNGLLTTFIAKLQPYKKYIATMESLSALSNSKSLIQINLEKFKRVIEKAND